MADSRAVFSLNCSLAHALMITSRISDGTRPAPQPYFEDDRPNPLSQYGRSKLAGEAAVAENCSDYAILRTAWLYGSHGSNFLKTLLRRAVTDPRAKRARTAYAPGRMRSPMDRIFMPAS